MAQEADIELNELDWISQVLDNQHASNLRQPRGSPQSAITAKQNASFGAAPATTTLLHGHELQSVLRFSRDPSKSTKDGQPESRGSQTSHLKMNVLADRDRDQKAAPDSTARLRDQDSGSDTDGDLRFESEPRFTGTVRLMDKETRAMITLNATLGTGLYWRGGLILRTGGPMAVLLSFLLVGGLAWAVMQCIAEFLMIWPISGALGIYVSEFVDKELGIAVGVMYWFTYAISFAALIATAYQEVGYWEVAKGVKGGVLFVLVPFVLGFINCFGVDIYGDFEVIFGTAKICFLAIILVVLVVANRMDQDHLQAIGGRIVDADKAIVLSQWPNSATVFNQGDMAGYAGAFFSSLSFAAFAYIGIEVAAACALEARVPKNSSNIVPGRTVKFTAIWFPFIAMIVYVLAGFLVAIDIPWNLTSLPTSQISGTGKRDVIADQTANGTESHCSTTGQTSSAFIIATEIIGNYRLSDTINVFLVFTALTCANTNLFVASRALFSLDCEGNSTAETVVDVLAEMGSVGVLIVWFCECWAFRNWKNCLEDRDVRKALEDEHIPMVRRWDQTGDYPYTSHGGSLTVWAALIGCVILLIGANGAPLWKTFTVAFLLRCIMDISED
ncbi:MAG: hypothetical protein M1822_004236 [Bathelium mastoideum]|nr:MAG: hypothetical protein M1822_004236 [Bathelium mastoideum]